MAIKLNSSFVNVRVPGDWGGRIVWSPGQRERRDLLVLLAKLGIKTARRPRHPYEVASQEEAP